MKFITALRNTGKRKRLALWRFVSLFLSNSLQNAKVFQVHTLNTFATLMMFINSACSVVQINVSETSMRHLWIKMKLYNKKDECFFPPFGFEALRFHPFLRNSDVMLESASNRHVSLRFWVMCNVVYVCKETIPHTSLHSAMNVYFDTWITRSQGHARPNMLRLSTVAKKHSMQYKCILCNNITREACTVMSTSSRVDEMSLWARATAWRICAETSAQLFRFSRAWIWKLLWSTPFTSLLYVSKRLYLFLSREEQECKAVSRVCTMRVLERLSR